MGFTWWLPFFHIKSNQEVIKISTQNSKNIIDLSNKITNPYLIAGATYQTADFIYGEARGIESIIKNSYSAGEQYK